MDIKQCKVASISLRIIQSTKRQGVDESTYIPSSLVWSNRKTLDYVADVVVREIRPQDVIAYHRWVRLTRNT